MAEPEIEVEAAVPSVSWLAEVTPVMVVIKVPPAAPAPCTAMASPTMLELKAPAGSLKVVLPEVTVPLELVTGTAPKMQVATGPGGLRAAPPEVPQL